MAVGPNLFLVDVRLKAIKTAIAMTSGAYKTSLVSYLTHRDLFPSLMKVWLGHIASMYEKEKTDSYQ